MIIINELVLNNIVDKMRYIQIDRTRKILETVNLSIMKYIAILTTS